MAAFCYTKFQTIPSIMPFTLTDGPHLCAIEMSLSNILMIDLFHSNNRMVIFSKTENLYHSKHVRNHTFMTSKGKGGRHLRGGRGPKICHVSVDYFVFMQKIYCSLLQIEERGTGHGES